ncbi:hypothetical protein [Desulfovibrio sp.]|uniref:hypothetical protein n=1 Tax=Desulfovibrio sp. TaxID=885 RepID=UPI0023D0DE5A|nr:hypothetical protein [Desulfovibrio sp.]MDE7242258.1 hypothetical protein [Desulfovibrio sp.]
MLEKLYNAIRRDAAPSLVKVGGRDYVDKDLEPIHAPCPQPLAVSTLTALADYLNTNVDELERGKLICHVESPEKVSIRSALLGDFADRACYILAKLDQLEIPFNQWKDAETFNIILQSCFAEPEGLAATDKGLVLKYIGSIVAINESATSDDGITQAVAVKTGISSKAVKALPNPVTLRPYRTFVEVEQPASSFIFRCRQNGEGGVQFMLAEADGGAWRAAAMKNIKAFMEQAVPGLNVIA